MVTVIIRRRQEPTVVQVTQEDMSRALNDVNGSEIFLVDQWLDGLKMVRTPYVCLVEDDCVLSANYFSSNINLFNNSDHYRKLAMISSCIGVKKFNDRIYNYKLEKYSHKNKNIEISGWTVGPEREKKSTSLYHVQVGFVPGAIIRTSAIFDVMENKMWNEQNLIDLSANISFYFWGTNRRVQVNPNTTYVSTKEHLEFPTYNQYKVPIGAANIFAGEGI